MRLYGPVLLAALLPACSAGGPPDVPAPAAIDVPAAPGAAQPFAAAGARGILVSWTEPAPTGHALRFAEWDGTAFSSPRTVAEGADWFVNWADFPSVVAAGDMLAAHWLQRSGPGTYAYDVLLSTSRDGGTTWSPPARPHGDGTQTEHGFVSLFPHGGGFGAVWLDGRQFADAGAVAGDDDGHAHAAAEMQVRFTTIATDGNTDGETLLDGRACDCCQTAAVVTPTGPLVVYRDRSEAEVRDIYATRLADGAWTTPAPVHEDGWTIAGCPVNGPAADAEGDRVVVAWFTAADERPRVHVAFSDDGGASFAAPVRVDGGHPVGRVDVLMVGAERAFVVWLEHAGEGAELRGRLVDRSGRAGAPRTIAATSAQRASGFPRMARKDRQVLLTWTEAGTTSAVRGVVLDFGP